MKKWFKKFVIGFGILGLVAGLSACGHHSPEEREAHMVKKLTKKLDLTDDQKPYAEDFVKEVSAMRQEMRKLRKQQMPQIRTLAVSENVTEQDIDALVDAQADIIKSHRVQITQKLVAFHKVLTPEQKKELDEKLEHIQERMDDHDDH